MRTDLLKFQCEIELIERELSASKITKCKMLVKAAGSLELIEYKDILLVNKGMELNAWCIMSSHVHMIIGSHGDKLEDIMRNMKRHTAETLKTAIREHPGESRREWMIWMMQRAGKKNSNNINFQLWQQDNHPIELATPKITHQKLDYLHYNPAVAGIVEQPEDYLYSSAIDYYTNRKGLIDIERIDPILLNL